MQQSYVESMRHWGYGYGFLEPESSIEVAPGYCGYIDDEGRWRKILDLKDQAAINEGGYTPLPRDVIRGRTDTRKWGPRYTSTVSETKIDSSAGGSAAAAGVPVEVSVYLEYKLNDDFGALLLTDGGGIERRSFRDKDPFRKWFKANAQALLKNVPDLETHGVKGVYIITQTLACDQARLTSWTDRESTVSLSFKAGVVPFGEVAPATECYRAHTTSGWTSVTAEEGEKKVLFFSGVQFKIMKWPFRWRSFNEAEQTSFGLRGGDDRSYTVHDICDIDVKYDIEATDIEAPSV